MESASTPPRSVRDIIRDFLAEGPFAVVGASTNKRGKIQFRVDDWEREQVRMRGREGSTVEITVRRENFDDPLTFYLRRQKIRVASVRHELLDGAYGYLRLSQFNETTAGEASDAAQPAGGCHVRGEVGAREGAGIYARTAAAR